MTAVLNKVTKLIGHRHTSPANDHCPVANMHETPFLSPRSLRQRSRNAFLLAVFVMGLPAPIAAAGTASQDREGKALEEITVIGVRDWRTGPASELRATVLMDDSQLSLDRSVADWLERVPGISLNGQGGLLQAYSIRGFSRARIRTDVDGVPIITDRRAGNSASFLPPDLLSRVDVINGPSSSLYGSGALGGVVNLATLSPEGASLKAQARSNDDMASLTLATGAAGGPGVALSLRRASNAEAGNGEELNTQFRQIAGVFSGQSDWRDLEIDYRWIPSVGRDIGRSNSLYPQVRQSTTPDEHHSIARVEARADDWLLRAYHHYQNWDTDVLRVASRRNLTSYQAHTLGGLFHQRSVGIGDEGSWGIEWVGRRGVEIRERETSLDGLREPLQQLVDGEEDTLGVFFDQGWIWDRLIITSAARSDFLRQSARQESESDLRLSGSLALDYELGSDWDLRLELASGFRFPSLSERYFNGTTPRGEIIGNRALDPELRTGLEFGLSYAPSQSSMRFDVNLYHSELEDYIERFRLDASTLSFRNLDRAHISGVDLALSASTGTLDHTLSYQWQEGEDAEGRTLADLNPAGWRYFLDWRREDMRLRSDIAWRPARSEFGAGEQPIDSALIWNLALAWQASSRVSWELQLNNVSDETYLGSADDLAPLQPGRAVAIVLSWQA